MKKLSINAGTFEQKFRTLYTEKDGLVCEKITALALADETLYAGTDRGLFVFDGQSFHATAVREKVSCLYVCPSCGRLFIGSGKTLLTWENGQVVCTQDFDCPVVRLCRDDSTLWLATENDIYRYSDGSFCHYTGVEYGGVTDMTVFGDRRMYCVNHMGIMAIHGKRPHWTLLCHLTCDLPACKVNAVAHDGNGFLWVGTDKGTYLYDGFSAWYGTDKLCYLPKGNIKSITMGKDSRRYFATEYGLAAHDGVKSSVLTAGRWLPYGEITAVAAAPDGKAVWVAAENRLSEIRYREITLGQKAQLMQQLLDTYYDREGYFTHCELEVPCDMSTAKPAITDNDGLFTGVYLGAQSYKYAVTGDEETKKKCDRAAKALLRLESITGKDGFTARAYRRPGEDEYGNGNSEWHRAEDEKGPLEWRGETSSDEMVGHFFGLSLYYDLVADEQDRKAVAASLCKIVDHAMSHNGMLHDVDDLPTTWAHWGPEELNRDDIRSNERGVNSLEYLMMLKVAYSLSGEQRYADYYDHLIRKEHYALNAARHKVKDAHVCHIDDNLCFLTSLTLFRYEKNEHLRQVLLMGLRHHWEYERIERAPLWNIAYGAITGEFCELDTAVRSLEQLPLDMICYETKNSLRPDIEWDEGQELFDGEPQLRQPLPYDEYNLTNFDGNPFIPDKGKNGNSFAANPHIFLLPYWLGRYYGLIAED